MFGPERFDRETGKPRQVSASFAAPFAGWYCLSVVNGIGDPPHGQRVSAAVIALDGEQVIGPDRFSQQAALIQQAVHLEPGEHRLEVELRSKPGSFFVLTIAGRPDDVDPPLVRIDNPADRTITTEASILVSGHAQDSGSGIERVEVNGIRAQLADGAFVAEVPLVPGLNELVAVAWDRAGNTARDTVTVELLPWCPCVEEVAARAGTELVTDEHQARLDGLGCAARVVTLWNLEAAEGAWRTVVVEGSGRACSWEGLQRESRRVGAEAERQRVRLEVLGLPGDWSGDVVVWYRSSQPALASGLSKQGVLALLDDPAVGRLALPEDRLVRLAELGVPSTCEDCALPCSGNRPDEEFCRFNLTRLARETSCGEGVRIGIHEGNVYNLPAVYDSRLKDPFASLQLGSPGGWFWPEEHANWVASNLWARSRGYARNSEPISVGIGHGESRPEVLFGRYLDAMLFFLWHGAYAVNYSSYYPRDWAECADAPTWDYELLQDYYQHQGGLLIVQAVGNMCESGNLCLRLSNALTVGGAATSQTEDVAYYGGGMEIPDVVGGCHFTGPGCEGNAGFWALAPSQPGAYKCGGGNSFNAPAVTATAAMLRELAMREGKAATRPEVLRAIIMASADYRPFLGCQDCEPYEGPDASRLCTGCPGVDACPAVDCYFGAGFLDAGAARYVYAGDRFEHHRVDASDWEITREFACDVPGCVAKAALAWSSAVDCDRSDCSGDGRVTHDFDLVLEQERGGAWVPVQKSQRRGGTTEWLRAKLDAAIEQGGSNRFRYRIRQVSRSVDRPTHLGFAAWTFPGDDEQRWQVAGIEPKELVVSQDGRTLAFVSRGDAEGLVGTGQSLTLMRSDGSCLRHFSRPGKVHTGPSISADGTRVAYAEHQLRHWPGYSQEPYSSLRVASVEYSPETCFVLTDDIQLSPDDPGVFALQPSISADGLWVAWTSNQDGDFEIYLAAADGSGEPVQITNDEPGVYPRFIEDRNPSLCGDSSVLSWITSVERGGITDPIAVVKRIDAWGNYGEIAVLDTTDTAKSGPVTSDDCTSIAFAGKLPVGPGGQSGLFLAPADGLEPRALWQGPAYLADLSVNALLIPFIARDGLAASLVLTTWYGTEPRTLVPAWPDVPDSQPGLACAYQGQLEHPYAPEWPYEGPPDSEPRFWSPQPLCEYAVSGAGDRIFFIGRLAGGADNVYSIPHDWDPYDDDRRTELRKLTFNR